MEPKFILDAINHRPLKPSPPIPSYPDPKKPRYHHRSALILVEDYS